MSKLSINLKMDIVAVAICPVVETLIGDRRSLKTTETLDHFISIDMFNEMIELYNEKHKDDDNIKSEVICKIDASSLDPHNNINN